MNSLLEYLSGEKVDQRLAEGCPADLSSYQGIVRCRLVYTRDVVPKAGFYVAHPASYYGYHILR